MLIPESYVDGIVKLLEARMPDHVVEARTLTALEHADVIGVYVDSWQPDEESVEIGAIEATINRYNIKVQNLRFDADELAGRAAFVKDCRKIRAILYRDPTLPLTFGQLQETVLGSTERYLRYKVTRQTFLNSRASTDFMYLCTTDMTIWTSTTKENP